MRHKSRASLLPTPRLLMLMTPIYTDFDSSWKPLVQRVSLPPTAGEENIAARYTGTLGSNSRARLSARTLDRMAQDALRNASRKLITTRKNPDPAAVLATRAIIDAPTR